MNALTVTLFREAASVFEIREENRPFLLKGSVALLLKTTSFTQVLCAIQNL